MAEYGLHTYSVNLPPGLGVSLEAVCREKGWRLSDGRLVIERQGGMSWSNAYRYCAERGARLPTVVEAVIISEEVDAISIEGQRPSYYPYVHTASLAVARKLNDGSAQVHIFESNSYLLEYLSEAFAGEDRFVKGNLAVLANSGFRPQATGTSFRAYDGRGNQFLLFYKNLQERGSLVDMPGGRYLLLVPAAMVDFESLERSQGFYSVEHTMIAPISCSNNRKTHQTTMFAVGSRFCEVRGIVACESKGHAAGRLSVCLLSGNAGTISLAGGGELSRADDSKS